MPRSRKPISDRTRFEVFKRDSFKCQYCGAAAPDVLLQVDHIKPVAGGGGGDVLNLITSCVPCNGGKGARPLTDHSAVEKQRAQLEELQERRAQLDMMLRWREGLQGLEDEKAQIIINKVNERLAPHKRSLNTVGLAMVRRWIVKFGFEAALHGVQQAFEGDPDALISQMEQFAAAAAKVAREPELRDYWRIRARLRARQFRYGPEWAPIEDMRRAFRSGWTIADMDAAANEAEDYAHFQRLIGYE